MGGMDGWLPGMENEQRKPELSQWYTPPMLAEQVWRWANKYKQPRIVCEPSAGRGALIRPILETPHHCIELLAVEIDPDNLSAIRRVMAHYERRGVHTSLDCGDYLTRYRNSALRRERVFDLTLMNPPYEDGKAEEFILHATAISTRVVGIFKASILHGVERYQKLWRECVTTREVRLAGRPSFGVGESGSDGGKTDFVVLEICRRPELELPWAERTVRVEHWP